MVIREYPEKSWSSSKMSMLERCEYEFYANYFGSHNGWLSTSSCVSKELYKFKKLTNIHMIKGMELHNQFKIAINELKDNKTVLYKTSNDINNAVVNKLREATIESINNIKSGQYEKKPKGIMIQDYFFGGNISKETADKLKEEVRICSENFFESSTYDAISSLSTIEIIENDEDGFDNCLFYDDTKLYFKVDLLYKEEDGIWWVVDWKTGKYDEKDKEQLLMYVYYVTKKYGIEIDKVRGRLEYLLTGEKYELRFNKFDLKYMEDKIKQDILRLESHLDDISLNKPKDESIFKKNIDISRCVFCKFKLKCLV